MEETVYKDEASDEWFFASNRFIVSETDEKGIITYVNPVFCEIANIPKDQLIGAPHNIIRHTDMPKAAFADLWDKIKSVGFWTGYVKNARRGGGFYWVYAMVLRHIDSDGNISYLSVRTQPNRNKVEALEPIYAEMKRKE